MYALRKKEEIAVVVRERCKSLERGKKEARILHSDGRSLSPWLFDIEAVVAAAQAAVNLHGRHAVRLWITTDE
jgi:hypothetical protein